jgi:uncharacterized lipoprotein
MKQVYLTLLARKKLAALGLFALMALTACTHQPSHLIVAPQLSLSKHESYQGHQAQLQVSDMRIADHIIEIIEPDKARQIYSSQTRLDTILQKQLAAQYVRQGLSLRLGAENNIALYIDQAKVKVAQQTFKYQVKSEIVMRVIVTNKKQTLTKTFRQSGTSEGPLQADIAVLERDFNQNLSQLLQQILTNSDLQDILSGASL